MKLSNPEKILLQCEEHIIIPSIRHFHFLIYLFLIRYGNLYLGVSPQNFFGFGPQLYTIYSFKTYVFLGSYEIKTKNHHFKICLRP